MLDGLGSVRWSWQCQMILSILRYVKHILITLGESSRTHIWEIFWLETKCSPTCLSIVVSSVNTWLLSVAALYVLGILWLRLCLLCESDGLRWEEHVAVVGQGVRPAHCGLSHAQQVAVGRLFRIELLCLWWGEKKVRVSNGTWRVVCCFFTGTLSHCVRLYCWYLFRRQWKQGGSSCQRNTADRQDLCMSEMTDTELPQITESACLKPMEFSLFSVC